MAEHTSAEQRVRELGLSLPSGSAPAANYTDAVRSGVSVVVKAIIEVEPD